MPDKKTSDQPSPAHLADHTSFAFLTPTFHALDMIHHQTLQRPRRLVMLVFLLVACVSPITLATSFATINNVTTACDPTYEQVSASGTCDCRAGFQGSNCRLCSDDAACASIHPDASCVKGFTYSSTTASKSYTCVLSKDLQVLLPHGALEVTCDRDNEQGTANCTAVVYQATKNKTVPKTHMMECRLSQCSFPTGSANGECGAIECKCGSECSAMTKALVEGSLSGKPARLQVKEGTHEMSLLIEGSPLPLSATCEAGGCEGTDTSGHETTTAATKAKSTALGDTRGRGLAMLACGLLATLFLIGGVAFCCVPIGCGPKRQDEENLEDELLRATTRSVKCLEFRRVSCYATTGKHSEPRWILDNISGKVAQGEVLGLLGPSGSGKTSLLNALAAVQNGQSKFAGELLVNGQKITKAYRRLAAYVQQDDTLYPTLTVRECITYSARLRLPLSMTDAAKNALVHRVMAELNLGHVANARIGSVGGTSAERGISGGERRRVSIGMELVTSPQILILDEPTSGLDSSSAHAVVKIIKELASHDRIVIMSIHQPSARSFFLLDKILLLGKGQLVYSGSPADAKDSFQQLGFKCPENENVADFILDIATNEENVQTMVQSHPSNGDHEQTRSSTKAFSTYPEYSPKTPAESPAYKVESSPYIADDASETRTLLTSIQLLVLEIRILFVRTALNILRNRSLFVLHVVLSVALGLCGGLIFNNVSDNLAGFQNRMGAFYFTLTFFGFASLSSMDVFLSERPIFLRETGAMYYGAFSYFLAKTALDSMLLRVLPASLFAGLFYKIMGLQAEGPRFLLFLLTVVLFNVAAGSICLVAGVLAKRVGVANLGATVVLLIMLLFGGFLLNAQTMPGAVAWLKHCSIFGYAFEILMVNELQGIVLSFDAPGYPSVPIFGEVYLKTLGMHYADRYYDVAALAVIALTLQLFAFVCLALQVPFHHVMTKYEEDEHTPILAH